jgi:protein subunit release factor A
VLQYLVPPDDADERNAVLEVRAVPMQGHAEAERHCRQARAGAGGEEAALFCMQMFHLYEKVAEHLGAHFALCERRA